MLQIKVDFIKTSRRAETDALRPQIRDCLQLFDESVWLKSHIWNKTFCGFETLRLSHGLAKFEGEGFLNKLNIFNDYTLSTSANILFSIGISKSNKKF